MHLTVRPAGSSYQQVRGLLLQQAPSHCLVDTGEPCLRAWPLAHSRGPSVRSAGPPEGYWLRVGGLRAINTEVEVGSVPRRGTAYRRRGTSTNPNSARHRPREHASWGPDRQTCVLLQWVVQGPSPSMNSRSRRSSQPVYGWAGAPPNMCKRHCSTE